MVGSKIQRTKTPNYIDGNWHDIDSAEKDALQKEEEFGKNATLDTDKAKTQIQYEGKIKEEL